jgi:hypothetical protein
LGVPFVGNDKTKASNHQFSKTDTTKEKSRIHSSLSLYPKTNFY